MTQPNWTTITTETIYYTTPQQGSRKIYNINILYKGNIVFNIHTHNTTLIQDIIDTLNLYYDKLDTQQTNPTYAIGNIHTLPPNNEPRMSQIEILDSKENIAFWIYTTKQPIASHIITCINEHDTMKNTITILQEENDILKEKLAESEKQRISMIQVNQQTKTESNKKACFEEIDNTKTCKTCDFNRGVYKNCSNKSVCIYYSEWKQKTVTKSCMNCRHHIEDGDCNCDILCFNHFSWEERT